VYTTLQASIEVTFATATGKHLCLDHQLVRAFEKLV
jgi:hypothetical protein